MSLRTEFLDDLNILAKRKDVDALVDKMREIMVDRHPATLSPEEQDPVATVVLGWKEVASRGRRTFEDAALIVISRLERAWVEGRHMEGDLSLFHAVLKLLQMLPASLVEESIRTRIVRMLAGLIAERQTLVRESAADGAAIWTDAFRLYLLWHDRCTAWLDTIWKQSLSDHDWPIEHGAFVFLEDAARRHPGFVTMDRLVTFWRSCLRRNQSTEDLKRWFYVLGATLEDSREGKAFLDGLHDQFGGHLQDHQHETPGLPWDHFVEAVSAMFRNPSKQDHIRSFKSAARTTATAREHHDAIPPGFKAAPASVNRDLIRSLLYFKDAA